jgi:transposase
MKTFLTLSDKTEIEAPLYYFKNLKKLKKLNRNLDVNASINIKLKELGHQLIILIFHVFI